MGEESKSFVKGAVMPSSTELAKMSRQDKRFQAAKCHFKRRPYPGILGEDDEQHTMKEGEEIGRSEDESVEGC